MKRNSFAVYFCFFIVLSFMANSQNAACASEKKVILKGLSIGMDINDARKKCEVLLSRDWIISPIDSRYRLLAEYKTGIGDERIFNANKLPMVGKKGFLIKNKDGFYGGFISDDEENNKVSQITFSGRLTDYIFSTSGMYADDLVEQIQDHYELPNYSIIIGGWTFTSKNGYIITIRTDKFLDIKKEVSKKPRILFD